MGIVDSTPPVTTLPEGIEEPREPGTARQAKDQHTSLRYWL